MKLDVQNNLIQATKSLYPNACPYCKRQSWRLYALHQDVNISNSVIYSNQPTMTVEDLIKRLQFLLSGAYDNDCDGCNSSHTVVSNLIINLQKQTRHEHNTRPEAA